MLEYSKKVIKLNDLYLDPQNPRFASSLSIISKTIEEIQNDIVLHLLNNEDVVTLAEGIKETGGLYPAELPVIIYENGKAIIVEGNRRICACKLLINPNLIPAEYKNKFPFLNNDSDKSSMQNIAVVEYPDRLSAQSYLSNRHIIGARSWSSLEKNNHYTYLFKILNKNLAAVCAVTGESESEVKTRIFKYNFFTSVLKATQEIHSKLSTENLDYLPLVDRFMKILVGDDAQVGLKLAFDSFNLLYHCEIGKEAVYKQILQLLGDAFLVRKERAVNGELSRIVSPELSNITTQKQLILEDIRIPGLLGLIEEYNKPVSKMLPPKTNITSGTNFIPPRNNNDGEAYSPTTKYKPKRTNRSCLTFTNDEAKNFNIGGNSDTEEKIKCLISNLQEFSVNKYPYVCALLYRTLLESSTIFAYGKLAIQYVDTNNLESNISNISNNHLFSNVGSDADKTRKAIKGCVNQYKLIDILNDYVHKPKPVDSAYLISTWGTMKFYIIACLEK